MSTKPEALPGDALVDGFTAFVEAHEANLRHALCAALGSEAGCEATADALAYGWEHWDRVSEMESPGGYLYRVGRDRGRKYLRSRPVVLAVPDAVRAPLVEPGLAHALASLPERQRVAVMLTHCFGQTLGEVASQLGIAKGTVQKHRDRGMAALRRELGAHNDRP